ncbi:MAG: M23 family metallopeptidase [Anaeromyxobacteraceae bacterium]
MSSTEPLPRRRSKAALLAGLAVALAGAGSFAYLRGIVLSAPPPPPATAPAAAPAPVQAALIAPPARFKELTLRLAHNQTIGQALFKMELAAADATAALKALEPHVPFRKARAGDQLRVERAEDGSLHRFTYRQGRADEWTVQRTAAGALEASKRPVEVTTEVRRVEVKVASSLYESMAAAGEDPALAVLASDVLAWDVDFYRDVQQGDVLRVVVERVLADGQPLRYGDVLAAEYVGETTGTRRLFRYVDAEGKPGYYDDAGQSAQRGFLKSPLKYAHLTSRFGSRKHPVLGYTRMHEGVDYGAPVGTPVWAVGDGRVEQAGWNGGCGKAVTLRHRNGFETVYCHLSSVAVSAGKGVAQKQIIGYTGQTGLATGPHLHYMVKKGGHAVNPLTLQLPREAPIPAAQLEDYRAKIAPLQARLRGESVALN